MSSGVRYRTHLEALRGTLTKVVAWWLKALPAYTVGLVGINVLYFSLGEPFYPLYTALGFVLITVTIVVGGTLLVYLYTALAGGIMNHEERERRRSEGSLPR